VKAIGRRSLLVGLAAGSLALLAGCQAQSRSDEHPAKPADLASYAGLPPGSPAVQFPAFVTNAVKDGYQFAAERPDVLRVLPCYCGCGLTAGHRSNLDCFVAGATPAGVPVFDEHASFCQTCLDIARDARRLVTEGKSLRAIRAYVDERHSSKGPGTDTPLPPDEGMKG
jgi:hypothetical protein